MTNKGLHKSDREKYLLPDEFDNLLHAARKNEYHVLLLMMAGNLGLRVGELISLRIEDLRLGEGMVLVKTLKQRKGHVLIRELAIPPQTMALLKKHIQGRRKGWIFTGDSSFRGKFREPQSSHKHISDRGAQKIFKRYAKSIGLGPRYSIHSLRHYYGMELAKILEKPADVAKALGHKRMETVLWYMHITQGKKEEISRAIASIERTGRTGRRKGSRR